MWAEIAKAAVKFGGTYLAASAKREQARIANFTARENAKNANKVRQSNNILSAAQGDLSRLVQGINDRRLMESTGTAIETAYVNSLRQEDAARAASFEQQLAAAEQEGAQAAAVGFSGAAGSVVDNINSATALRNARAESAVGAATDQREYDISRYAASLWEQGASGLSVDTFYTQLDYGRNTAQLQQEVNPWAVALRQVGADFLGKAVSNFEMPKAAPAAAPIPKPQAFSLDYSLGSTLIPSSGVKL